MAPSTLTIRSRAAALLLAMFAFTIAAPAVAQDETYKPQQLTQDSNTTEAAEEISLENLENPLDAEQVKGDIIQDIRILGLSRTDPAVAERELFFAVGDPLDPAAINESIRRLRNIPIFRSVDYRITRATDGAGLIVWVALAEKWTTIPILKGGGGGGSNFFILGVYDPNSFGKYIELGAQYQNNNLSTHSGVLWMREPRLAGSRLKWSSDLWYQNTVRALYDDNAELQGAYNHLRIKFRNTFDQEVHRYVTVGVGLEIDQDSFNNKNLSDDQEQSNIDTNFQTPDDDASTIASEFRLILGELNREEYLFEGVQATNVFQRGSKLIGSELSLNRFTSETLAFLRLPWRSNLGARINLGHTNSGTEQHQFFAGGLDYKRGFFDSQFRGRNLWNASIEYRIPSIDNSWIVLQHVLFTDVGDVGNSLGDLATFKRNPPTSLGGGIRLMSPRIYRATIRIDYAYAFTETIDTQGISFSAAQFF